MAKTVAEEIRELGNRLAQINPEVDQQATEERYGDDDFGIGDVGRATFSKANRAVKRD